MGPFFVFVIVPIGFVLLVVFNAIKVVREYQRLVLFRLGKHNANGVLGPGISFVWPVIDQVVWVDLRESFLEIPEQTCITKDNAPVSVDFLIYWKVIDPALSVIQVRNFAGALQGIATTTLRAVVGDMALDEVLSKREQINVILRTKLDEVTGRWGGKVTSVEIREILPPTEVQSAMTKQMAAERHRRAVVTESDGTKQAAVTIAEGEKQSAILRAEGERQSQILKAEGYAKALESIFGAAKSIDAKTMSLQYLDTLKALGASPSTKYIFPMEFTTLLKPFVENIKDAITKK
ncbi:MAG: SPFH/Band 7/PHB domain protein [Candidatus Firestonebacteria bacterium]|jgi:regulator of protease activity HflC (stomatin/prohibitin superfamily)|nr:SPFH/Band 7/PHB domain protein [Candidatus Firestonebacteria bacterium]